MAKKHILCTLNGGGFTQSGGPRLIGCDRHGRTRRGVKKDYAVYGLYLHCWCGHDITRTWSSTAKTLVYEVFEKQVCSPEGHFSEHPKCPSTRGYSYHREDGKYSYHLGPVAQCGLHGLTYEHCRLCKESLPGKVEGIISGEWRYSPWTLAKRIYSAMK
jgi:hypothetical protein